MLYVMAERWKPAIRYRNAFERVKEVLFDRIPRHDQVTLEASELEEYNVGDVTDALHAFFANTQQVDALIDSVLSIDRESYEPWTQTDGQSWQDNLGILVDIDESVAF
jgi:hypothetical protein